MMSYNLVDIPLQNYQRIITDSDPLYVPLGALSAADATVMTIGVVVSGFAGTSADLTLEESYDAGDTWDDVSAIIADTINATGTFLIRLSPTNGPMSPNVRLKVTPAAATTIYISSLFRTFIQSNVMVPRDVSISGSATESTQLLILAAVDDLEALTGSTNTKIDTVNTNLGTIDTSIGAVETAVGTSNGYLASLDAKASGSLVPEAFDYVALTPGASDDTYVYKTGGAGGSTVKTVVVTYTDTSKNVISTVVAS